MPTLPSDYLANMQELLKDDFKAYLNSFDQQRTYGLRVNTLKIDPKDFQKIFSYPLEPIAYLKDSFYYNPKYEISKHPYYYAGLYYLQDPSAMIASEVLNIQKDDIVLDACAAPGGKSFRLINKLNNTGILLTNDLSASRATTLLKTVEKTGTRNAIVSALDLLDLNLKECFDKILLDAPCSGEGMFRKDPTLIKAWNEKNSSYYQPIQKALIQKAINLLKPGGELVYSTCTFNIQEDEQVVEYALNLDQSIELLPINNIPNAKKGINEKTKNCIRLYPFSFKGEGQFVALFKKNGKKIENKFPQTACQLEKYSFLNPFKLDTNNKKLVIIDDKYYLEPLLPFDLSSTRLLRSGLYLGKYEHSRFEPSQALALALDKNSYFNCLSLKAEDPRVLKYLKGETLNVTDYPNTGLTLVCLEDYPLGFGEIKNGTLKNKIAKNYRINF